MKNLIFQPKKEKNDLIQRICNFQKMNENEETNETVPSETLNMKDIIIQTQLMFQMMKKQEEDRVMILGY